MGNFYTNIALLGPDPGDVCAELRAMGRRAYVTPRISRITVVYDEESDKQDTDVLDGLARGLSERFACPALAVLNHDDDVFRMRLYSRSRLRASYVTLSALLYGGPVSVHGLFPLWPAIALCWYFRRLLWTPAAWFVLQLPFLFLGQVLRHSLLALILGLPESAVVLGYDYVHANGECPDGMSKEDLLRSKP